MNVSEQQHPDPFQIAANTGPHCKRCSEHCGEDYLQCHHCGRYVCGACQSEPEDQTNSCSDCFPKEVVRLDKLNRELFQKNQQLLEKLTEWRGRYFALEMGLQPKPIPSESEVVLASRRMAQ